MKKMLLVIITILFCISITACKSKKENQNLEVSLYSNSSTGYEWSYTVSDENIISISSYYDDSNCEKNVVGCGGNNVYIIKGLKPGKVTLSMEYKFVVDGEGETETAIYEITVNDDLSINETHYGTYFNKQFLRKLSYKLLNFFYLQLKNEKIDFFS